ncbi:hypothetical protein [Rhodopila sp.]|jgi:hypothetical protein|uniref:hypothetical protein n=1 Tax=Rhodopila sp. TaxID=2480087 RepID=UPI002B6EC82B|nr:hypothetical protein [Rhodopila sp.]HVZ10363.1 hypothetical protein [Rhodopila sp.]
MKIISKALLTAVIAVAPFAVASAQETNPGNTAGGHDPVGYPFYPGAAEQNPALTTGSRYSVTGATTPVENPTVPGATGMMIVRGNHSTISGDRRATVLQKTSGSASDAPG